LAGQVISFAVGRRCSLSVTAERPHLKPGQHLVLIAYSLLPVSTLQINLTHSSIKILPVFFGKDKRLSKDFAKKRIPVAKFWSGPGLSGGDQGSSSTIRLFYLFPPAFARCSRRYAGREAPK
jgi:hypothetical protein